MGINHTTGICLYFNYCVLPNVLSPRPRHPNGHLYAAEELPSAFKQLVIDFPQCPCATQETDPDITHDYQIWVVQSGDFYGKVAAACLQKWNGCGSFGMLCSSLYIF